MFRIKFRPADPARRIPVYLQNKTKENFIWQLKLTGVMFIALWFWSKYEERELQRLVAKARAVIEQDDTV